MDFNNLKLIKIKILKKKFIFFLFLYLCFSVVIMIYENNREKYDKIFYQKYLVKTETTPKIVRDITYKYYNIEIGFNYKLLKIIACPGDNYHCDYLGGKVNLNCRLDVVSENNLTFIRILSFKYNLIEICKKDMLDYFYNRLLDHNKKIKLLVKKKLESEVLLFKLPNFKYRQFRDQLILSEVQKSDIYAKNLVNSLMSRTVEINSRKEKISSIYVYRNTILVIFSFLTIFIIFSLIRILKND